MKQRSKGHIPLIILISFIIAILIIPVTSAQEVTISIDNIVADPGGTCTAPVILKSIKDYGTGAITLKYDPSVVQVTDVTGSEDSAVVAWNADNELGEVKIAAWNIQGVSGDIDFAVITFEAAGKSGSTPLTIKVDQLITQDQDGVQKNIRPEISSGSLTVGVNSTPGFEVLLVLTVLGMISLYFRKIRKR